MGLLTARDLRDLPEPEKPWDHQVKELEANGEKEGWAILWEQGTGKSKEAVLQFAKAYEAGRVQRLNVIAPSGVHFNWLTDEIPAHLPPHLRSKFLGIAYSTERAETKSHQADVKQVIQHDGLGFMAMSYDSLMTNRGKKALWDFIRTAPTFGVADESTMIKTPDAARTKRVIAASPYYEMRRILNGTPVTQSPTDVYAQVRFIRPTFWRETLDLEDYTAFKAHFCIMKKRRTVNGAEFDEIVGYRHEDQLKELLASISSRVLKDDVLDIPPKLFTKRTVILSNEQRRVYQSLLEQHMATMASGATVTVDMKLTLLLRLQQVLAGYLPVGDEEPVERIGKTNPRIESAVEYAEQSNTQGIIWCRFALEIDDLMKRLGRRAVRYDGRISEEEALRNRLAFQRGDVQWFIGNPAKGATGLTLIQGKQVLYQSNSFNYFHRVQSEDRTHRGGQKDQVLYTDMQAVFPDGRPTVDAKFITNLRSKRSISDAITGDEFKAWIT